MRTPATFIAMLLAVATIACSAPSADDLVAEIIATRNNFEVRLSSWIDRDTETTSPYLYLDVDVVKNTEDGLGRLTVLVNQHDIDNNIVHAQRVPIDVSDMSMRGFSKKYYLEVRPIAPGLEGVTVELERNPERDTWGEFPELDRVRPRGQ